MAAKISLLKVAMKYLFLAYLMRYNNNEKKTSFIRRPCKPFFFFFFTPPLR